MKRTLRMLSLLVILFLLPLNVPGEEDLAGRWTGQLEEDVITLLFAQDESFILLYDEESEVSVNIGTWSLQPGSIRLQMQDGSVNALDYRMEGENLIAREAGDEPWVTFARAPWQPLEGVAGEWEGKDKNGTFILVLRNDNTFTFDYASGEPIGAGKFAEYKETFYLILSEESFLPLGFTLTGNEMTITNKFTGDSYPLTRRQTFPQDSTVPPETMPPEPTREPEPEETQEPEPEETTTLPDWLSDATPEPTQEPEPEGTTALPDWLSDATPEPMTEETVRPDTTQPPTVAPGLIGTWQGTDATGVRKILFSGDGFISITYLDPSNEALGKKGTFNSTSDTIIAVYGAGTGETFRFILMGDNLLLSDKNLQNPVTYTRVAEEEGVDSALEGTWGGYGEIGYFEYTFTKDGTATLLVLPDELKSLSGTASTREGILYLSDQNGKVEISYSIQDDILTLDGIVQARKMTGPLVRSPLPQGSPSTAVDPILLGVWGGMGEDVYIEHIFFADGKYERFCPSDEARNTAGNHMASGGNLAILTLQGSSQGTYAVEGNTLTLTFMGEKPVQLVRKDGILRRVE